MISYDEVTNENLRKRREMKICMLNKSCTVINTEQCFISVAQGAVFEKKKKERKKHVRSPGSDNIAR